MIAAAKRPLFYGGGGLINSGPEACAASPSWCARPTLPAP